MEEEIIRLQELLFSLICNDVDYYVISTANIDFPTIFYNRKMFLLFEENSFGYEVRLISGEINPIYMCILMFKGEVKSLPEKFYDMNFMLV